MLAKKFILVLKFVILVSCSFAFNEPLGAQTVAPGRIAVVHSYHASFGWVQEVNRGITSYLDGRELFRRKPKGLMRSYIFDYFYMDGKNHQKDRAFLQKQGQEIITKLNQIVPTLTIICDDEALEFVAKPLVNDPRHRFIFLGINNDPRSYGVVKNLKSPEKNITGLISEHPFYYSVKLMQQIAPQFKKMIVLFDDSTSGQGIMKDLRASLTELDADGFKKEQAEFVVTNDWSVWKKTVKAHQTEDVIFVIGTFYTLRDEKNQPLSTQQVADWITKNSKVPELTILSSHISEGFLLSISNPGFVHGYESMAIAEEIFSGKKISEIPIRAPQQKAVHINPYRANQLKLNIPIEILAMSKYFEKIGY